MAVKENNRKKVKGIIVSDKATKTRVVVVETLVKHPLYKKVLKSRKKFYAHDENEISKSGDKVMIEEARPMSKLKRWRVIEVLQTGIK